MSNTESTEFLNRFLAEMAAILSEKYDAQITMVARPKPDGEKQPA